MPRRPKRCQERRHRGAEAIAELRSVYMQLARKLFPNGMKSGNTKWNSYNEKPHNALYKHYEVYS